MMRCQLDMNFVSELRNGERPAPAVLASSS